MKKEQRYRFLFVSAPFSGIEVYVKNLREIVSQCDEIDAEWIMVEWNPPERLAKLPPFSLNWTLKASYVVQSRIRNLERAGHRFDAVFFNNIVLASFLPQFRKRVPSVFCLDVTPKLINEFKGWYLAGAARFGAIGAVLKRGLVTNSIYKDAVSIITWSELVRESLHTDYHVAREKIDVIPPGVNLRYWTSNGTVKSKGRVQVLFVGADFSRKGGDLLLAAAKSEKLTNCDFHFVTKNFRGEPRSNVFVYPNLDPNTDDLKELYQMADTFAMPTRADFSPNAICEAMACGLPVLSTRVGAIHEMVVHNKSGLLVDVDDDTALAQALTKLVESPQLRRTMGEAGRQLAHEKFDMQKNAKRVLNKMKDVSDRSPERHKLSQQELDAISTKSDTNHEGCN